MPSYVVGDDSLSAFPVPRKKDSAVDPIHLARNNLKDGFIVAATNVKLGFLICFSPSGGSIRVRVRELPVFFG
jgi:hypothetical protein